MEITDWDLWPLVSHVSWSASGAGAGRHMAEHNAAIYAVETEHDLYSCIWLIACECQDQTGETRNKSRIDCLHCSSGLISYFNIIKVFTDIIHLASDYIEVNNTASHCFMCDCNPIHAKHGWIKINHFFLYTTVHLHWEF